MEILSELVPISSPLGMLVPDPPPHEVWFAGMRDIVTVWNFLLEGAISGTWSKNQNHCQNSSVGYQKDCHLIFKHIRTLHYMPCLFEDITNLID